MQIPVEVFLIVVGFLLAVILVLNSNVKAWRQMAQYWEDHAANVERTFYQSLQRKE